MRVSKLVGRTIREVPAEAEIVSHQLLLRAGLIHQVASGLYVYGPLAWRAMQKVMQILREEMNAIDGQEINMPVTAPADLWKETGRWTAIGSELARFKDRGGRDMVLAMTHEETLTDYVRSEVNSYKQLPFMLYQIQTKFRDEPRSRGGLIRTREFYMKDGYSCHITEECMDAYYELVAEAYFRIFNRAGIDIVSVKSDNGMFGGKESHEYMYVTPAGEDKLIFCDHCRYAANFEVAERMAIDKVDVALAELRDVATPDNLDISGQAAYLGRATSEFMKTLAYISKGKLVLVVIRGDLNINEVKLKRYLVDEDLRLANEEEMAKHGLLTGFLSPVGRIDRVIADKSVLLSVNLISGANKLGFHQENTNLGRDFSCEEIIDIVAVSDGDPCPVCGEAVREARGIEVGNIFKLGTRYSENMNALVQDENGELQSMLMGCYGIGVGRTISASIEANHDAKGIIWPITIAPFAVHLATLGVEENVLETAEKLYKEMMTAGIEVLYDDRDLRPGVKLNDADLMGMPLRIVVSKRSLAEASLEVKIRKADDSFMVPLTEALTQIQDILRQLKREQYASFSHIAHISI